MVSNNFLCISALLDLDVEVLPPDLRTRSPNAPEEHPDDLNTMYKARHVRKPCAMCRDFSSNL